MAVRSPASLHSPHVPFAAFDVSWTLAAPPIALLLRDADALAANDVWHAALYCVVVFGVSLVCFACFRLHDGVTGHFSVHDAINIAKLVFSTTLVSSTILFFFTRLDGVPRSTPVIHALVLAAGLVGVRLLHVFIDRSRTTAFVRRYAEAEHVIMVGATRLTSLYIRFLEAYSEQTQDRRRVVGLLDDRPDLAGRAIDGVRVIGTSADLGRIVDEFSIHGIKVDRVVIGGDSGMFADEPLKRIEDVCTRRGLPLDFVPNLVGLQSKIQRRASPKFTPPATATHPAGADYFKVKPFFDVFAAAFLIVALAPVWLTVGLLVLIDGGLPILFWQQRIGRHGQLFMLHKFRTMRPPFDRRGEPLSEDQRQSQVGLALRALRFDELPQLLNVLVTEMSLVGPRPLLPNDQPARPGLRLSVRPGITGWAQVNGGRLLTPDEKEELDDWYIRNASFALDMRIIWKTVLMVFRGDRRSEEALVRARTERTNPTAAGADHGEPPPRTATASAKQPLGGPLLHG